MFPTFLIFLTVLFRYSYKDPFLSVFALVNSEALTQFISTQENEDLNIYEVYSLIINGR